MPKITLSTYSKKSKLSDPEFILRMLVKTKRVGRKNIKDKEGNAKRCVL